jgi:uncharacterized protein
VNVKARTSPDRQRFSGAVIIDLDDLPTDRLLLEGSLAPGELDFSENGIRHAKPLDWSGFIERKGSNFRLFGEVVTELELECVRCLNPVRQTVRREFDLFFQQRESLIYAEHEDIELEASETQTSFVTGSELPLNEIMQEQVLLALPMKPLCRADCRGLCAVCGIHLNEETCECSLPGINPAFEVLREFKQQLENPS